MATLNFQRLPNNLHDPALQQVLDSVRHYFFNRGESLPAVFIPQRNVPAESFAPIFMSCNPAPPPNSELIETLHLIRGMATPAGHAAMLAARDHGLINLDDAAVFDSPLDLAIKFWILDQQLLAMLHKDLKHPEPKPSQHEIQCAKPVETLPAEQTRHTIERREMNDGIHWFVDGVDKGVLCKRSSTDRALILDTLYERIGTGWVPHAFFMKHLDLPEELYKVRMQKQLNHLRKILGVKIECRKDKGVRFTEDVVRR